MKSGLATCPGGQSTLHPFPLSYPSNQSPRVDGMGGKVLAMSSELRPLSKHILFLPPSPKGGGWVVSNWARSARPPTLSSTLLTRRVGCPPSTARVRRALSEVRDARAEQAARPFVSDLPPYLSIRPGWRGWPPRHSPERERYGVRTTRAGVPICHPLMRHTGQQYDSNCHGTPAHSGDDEGGHPSSAGPFSTP